MFKFLNLQPEIFAIDINDLSLRIAKLKKKRKGFALVSFNELEIKHGIVKEGVIQDQEALIKLIALVCNAVKGKKLNTKYVIASLPEEKSFSQTIQMPRMTEEELRSAVPFEAENYIPLPIDKVYWDFQHITLSKNEKHEDHQDLLVNVMPKPIVDSYVYCLKKAGLTPCILEIESQAMVRALIKKDESTLPVIFVDFGLTKTSFLIFSANTIRFTSSIPISSQQLTNAIAEKFDISQSKAEELKRRYGLLKQSTKYDIAGAIHGVLYDLASQIKKYISFYHGHSSHELSFADGKIEKIILCGGGANLKGLKDFLAKELRIPVELGNPLVNILPEKHNAETIPQEKLLSFTTALGLALRGVSDNNFHD